MGSSLKRGRLPRADQSETLPPRGRSGSSQARAPFPGAVCSGVRPRRHDGGHSPSLLLKTILFIVMEIHRAQNSEGPQALQWNVNLPTLGPGDMNCLSIPRVACRRCSRHTRRASPCLYTKMGTFAYYVHCCSPGCRRHCG